MPSVLIALVVLACASVGASARADSLHQGTFWTGYMSSWWIDRSWALWFDTHYNVESFVVLRGGVTRAFEAGPSVTAGYAYLRINPDLDRQEHRPWAQAVIPLRLNDDWRFSQRIRTDFRFQQSLDQGEIVDGFDFTFRARFQSTFTRRLPKLRSGQPFVQISDEVLLNLGSTTLPVGLDQNRVSLLFGIELELLTIRSGYMNRYSPGSGGTSGVYEHGFILWFTQSVDLGRGETEQVPEAGGS